VGPPQIEKVLLFFARIHEFLEKKFVEAAQHQAAPTNSEPSLKTDL